MFDISDMAATDVMGDVDTSQKDRGGDGTERNVCLSTFIAARQKQSKRQETWKLRSSRPSKKSSVILIELDRRLSALTTKVQRRTIRNAGQMQRENKEIF